MAINGGVARELGVLTGEALRGNWTRLEGSTITLANRMNLLQYAFSPVGLAAIAAGAAVFAFGAEVVKGIEQSNEFAKALQQTGGAIGITEGQFNGMAESLRGSETTIGTAREAMLKLAESGKFSGDAMGVAGKAVVDFAALTGQSIDQAVDAVVKIQERPVQALQKLNEQYHFLSLAQLEHIQKLQDEGDATGAAEEAVKLFQETNTERLAKADEDVGIVIAGWRELKGAIRDAGDEVANFGRKNTLEQQIAQLQKQIDDTKNGYTTLGEAFGHKFEVYNPFHPMRADVSLLEEKLAGLQRQAADARGAASDKKQTQQVQDDGISAQKEDDAMLKGMHSVSAYNDALEKELALKKAIHAANPNDERVKGITFDDKGDATGGEGLEKIKAYLHKKYDVKAAAHQSEHKLAEEQLKQEEADQQVSNANKLKFELDFWTAKLGQAKQGSKAYADAYAQVNALTKQVDAERQRAAVQEAQRQQQAVQSETSAAIAGAQSTLAIEKEKIETRLALGQSSQQQETASLMAAYEREYQIEAAALQREMLLLAGKPKMVAQINKEIEKLQAQHALEMLKLDDKAAKDNQKLWQDRLRPINQAFQQSINGMIQGTQTLRQSMAKIGESIAAKFIEQGISMVVNWVANEAAKTTATTVGAASRATVEATAAAASKASDAATGKSQITSAAATGAAKAYQAIVGIPYVGPVLAPIAAGVAFAGIEAFSGMISSARGGWERVPFDGAMTELHKDEMVLPAHIANPMRQMAMKGGQGGNAAGPVHIHTTDPRGFKDMLRRNPGVIADAIKNANRRGHFAGSTR
jgi:phage-related minor tail protein